MVRFIRANFDLTCYKDFTDPVKLDDFPRAVNNLEYLDMDDPTRLVNHFNVKSLLKPENQAYLKTSVSRKAFDKCAILLRDPLSQFGKSPQTMELEIPIRSLWCQAALFLAQFQKEPDEDYLCIIYGNCTFLLKSGILSCLGESRAKEAADHISTIVHLALKIAENSQRVQVCRQFSFRGFITSRSKGNSSASVFSRRKGSKRKKRRLKSTPSPRLKSFIATSLPTHVVR